MKDQNMSLGEVLYRNNKGMHRFYALGNIS